MVLKILLAQEEPRLSCSRLFPPSSAASSASTLPFLGVSAAVPGRSRFILRPGKSRSRGTLPWFVLH